MPIVADNIVETLKKSGSVASTAYRVTRSTVSPMPSAGTVTSSGKRADELEIILRDAFTQDGAALVDVRTARQEI